MQLFQRRVNLCPKEINLAKKMADLLQTFRGVRWVTDRKKLHSFVLREWEQGCGRAVTGWDHNGNFPLVQ